MRAEKCGLTSLHSTREEVRANLATEVLIHQLNDKFGNGHNHEVRYLCDSRNAQKKQDTPKPGKAEKDPLEAEADMMMEIERLRQHNNNINRQYEWVKGHQKPKRNLEKRS